VHRDDRDERNRNQRNELGVSVRHTWGIAAFRMGLVVTIVQHAALDAAPVGRESRVGAAVVMANTLGVAAGTGPAALAASITARHLPLGAAAANPRAAGASPERQVRP
jgi:hypothetical protein